MARMIPLTPAPRADIGPGPFSLVATEAGRYAQGLRFTSETWNGTCLGSAQVLANKIAPYVAAVSQLHSLSVPEVQRAVLDLIVAIEDIQRTRSDPRPGQTPDLRPEIELTIEITDVADQTEAALLQMDAPLYQHARRLVSIAAGLKPPKGLTRPKGVPQIRAVPRPLLTEWAAQAARFYTRQQGEKVYCRPAAWLMQTLLARTERPFAPLEAIVHAPTLRPDGTLLDTEGYDPDTGLYLALGGIHYPSIPTTPSRDEAVAALAQLTDPFVDFPFAEPWHKSAALAMLLTLVCRHFVQGSVPLGGISAHTQGAGKGLLATVMALIGTGRPCAFWPQPINEEEERKRLLAIGLQGDSVVCIDNVTRVFGSGTFANVLTGHFYEDRILGVTQPAEVRFHCVWLATGNNLTYVEDIARRTVPIVLDPRMERPEERTGFTYPHLLQHVRDHRVQLVTAALTVMLAYAQAGCPRQSTTTYGSFELWYERICGALMWLGEPDPCEGRKALQAAVEEDLLQFRQLVLCWHACYHASLSTPRTLKHVTFEIQQQAAKDPDPPNAWDDLRDALGAFEKGYDGQQLHTRSAGYALRKYQRRVIDNKRFVAGKHTMHGTPWHIEVV